MVYDINMGENMSGTPKHLLELINVIKTYKGEHEVLNRVANIIGEMLTSALSSKAISMNEIIQTLSSLKRNIHQLSKSITVNTDDSFAVILMTIANAVLPESARVIKPIAQTDADISLLEFFDYLIDNMSARSDKPLLIKNYLPTSTPPVTLAGTNYKSTWRSSRLNEYILVELKGESIEGGAGGQGSTFVKNALSIQGRQLTPLILKRTVPHIGLFDKVFEDALDESKHAKTIFGYRAETTHVVSKKGRHKVISFQENLGIDLFNTADMLSALTEHQAYQLIHDLLLQLSALKAHKLVHGDLKPENIVCSPDDMTKAHIIDLSCVKNGASCVTHTPGFQAPEHKALRGLYCAHANDVYGMGVTLIEILSQYTSYKLIGNDVLKTPSSEKMLDSLFEQMIKRSSEVRATVESLLEQVNAVINPVTADMRKAALECYNNVIADKLKSPEGSEQYQALETLGIDLLNALRERKGLALDTESFSLFTKRHEQIKASKTAEAPSATSVLRPVMAPAVGSPEYFEAKGDDGNTPTTGTGS